MFVRTFGRLIGVAVIFHAVVAMAETGPTKDALLAQARQVLSPIQGELVLPGLQQPVEVLRDRWGVAHIYAKNSHDLFLAQGYVVAQDRLFQLDLWRRVGLGELAEIYGESSLEGDRFARLMLYRGDMEAEWASYSPDAREIATAFTAGINAWIDQVGDRLPIEFQVLGYRPKKWRPEDILARMSGLIMVSNWEKELSRARLIAEVGVERARQLSPTDPPVEYAPDPQLDLSLFAAPITAGFQAATRPLKFVPAQTESNNWVVDGTLSASGQPLLASDPHRSTTLPSLRYLVHLNAPGWNVIGAGEPALPGVAIGHNDRVAWGFTIVGTDQADVVVEETDPQNPRQSRVGDRWEAMRVVEEAIVVKGREQPVKTELRFTRNGPVIYQDETKRVAIALKWVGSEPGAAAYLASLSVARVQSAGELVQALERWKIPALNFVFADVTGQIGWVAAGLTPNRPHHLGILPVLGATGQAEWRGFLSVADLPQIHNPPRHFVATANHNILPPGYSRSIAYDWSSPYRFQRIEQRLTAGSRFTIEDFQSIQHESTSLLAQQLVQIVRNQPQAFSSEQAPFVKLLTAWDGKLSRESSAAAIYSVWLQELMNRFYAKRIPQSLKLERGDLRSHPVLVANLVEPRESIFGSQPAAVRDQLLNDALAAAIQRLQQRLGNDPQTWQWGQLHTATFEHPLGGFGAAHQQAWNVGPVARSGDSTTPNNTRANDEFRQIHGASYRHIFDLADWDRGVATSTPGQSGQPGSPHYDDLLPLWANEQYFPLRFSRQAVEGVTANRLMLRPQ